MKYLYNCCKLHFFICIIYITYIYIYFFFNDLFANIIANFILMYTYVYINLFIYWLFTFFNDLNL